MRYIPNTDADCKAMLQAIGVRSVEELFADNDTGGIAFLHLRIRELIRSAEDHRPGEEKRDFHIEDDEHQGHHVET
jgi:hypothetical protein